jgi:tetratricopeptide (TPR) repeat protein
LKRVSNRKKTPQSAPIAPTAALDELIAEITLDAYGEQEQLWAFRQALEDSVALPAEGFVVGEPVVVVGFEYDGNERRGMTAKCRRADGREYLVTAADVTMTRGAEPSRCLAAYRKWIGLPPYPRASGSKPRKGRSGSEKGLVDTAGPVELAVLSLKQRAARCRVPGSDEEITLRGTRLWDAVPGEIVLVRPQKQGTYAGNPYLSAKIESTRLDVGALRLAPLKLEPRGTWDPLEQYWGEEGEPIEAWARPIIARGRRPQFEMEQVLPGMDPEDPDPDADPIGQAVDRNEAGDRQGAYKVLMDLCRADLRCLDAHAHLGYLVFDGRPADAIRHYEAGFRIGELSLPKDFDGVLSWGWIDNRPFLRCMHGFGLCLWRLKRFDEAQDILQRMLWLNPSDNQGVRCLVDDVRAKVVWEDSRNR